METTSDSGALGGNVLPVGVQPLQPGDPASVGGHRLTGRLSRGESTTVYLGRDSRGDLVAIKTTLARDSSQVARRLRAQASAAQRLPAFCTAALLVDGSDQSPPYLVSEYVEGPSLEEFVAEMGPLEPSRLTALAAALAEALAAIHSVGVVHRGLRPTDVLLAADGPRVIGFSVSDTPAGTALEPVRTSPKPDGDPRSDVFAWGRVIGYAATGRNPVTHPAALDSVSEPVRSLVAAALADDPAARPAAQDLLNGLGVTPAVAAEVSSEDSTEVFSRIPAEGPVRLEAPVRPALAAPSVWDPSSDHTTPPEDPHGTENTPLPARRPAATGHTPAPEGPRGMENVPRPVRRPAATGHAAASETRHTAPEAEPARTRLDAVTPPQQARRSAPSAEGSGQYVAPSPPEGYGRHDAPSGGSAQHVPPIVEGHGRYDAPGQDTAWDEESVRHPGPPVGRTDSGALPRSPATNPNPRVGTPSYDEPARRRSDSYAAASPGTAAYADSAYTYSDSAPRGKKPPARKTGRSTDRYQENVGRRWFKALAVISIPVTLAAVFAAFIVTTSTNRYTGGQTPLDPPGVPPTSDQDVAHSAGPSVQGRRGIGPRHRHTATPGLSETPSAPVTGLPGGSPSHTVPGLPGHSHPPTHSPTHSPSPTPSPTPTGSVDPPQ